MTFEEAYSRSHLVNQEILWKPRNLRKSIWTNKGKIDSCILSEGNLEVILTESKFRQNGSRDWHPNNQEMRKIFQAVDKVEFKEDGMHFTSSGYAVCIKMTAAEMAPFAGS